MSGLSENLLNMSVIISLAKGISPVDEAPAPKKKIGLGGCPRTNV